MTSWTEADWNRVVRYLTGDAKPPEAEETAQWIAADPTRAEEFAGVRQLWNSGGQLPAGINWRSEVPWERTVGQRPAEGATSQSSGYLLGLRPVFSGKSLRRWVGYAIAIINVIATASWQMFYGKSKSPASIAIVYTTYATKSGQRASLTLNNGARVILGPSTILRVPKGVDSGDGVIVDVNGEALFDITPATRRPFTVTAHGVTTRVLGTEFVVRAYDASRVRIAVRDGRISVQAPLLTSANTTIVSAGEAVSVSPHMLPEVTPIVDIATEFAWANGELVLRNAPLGETLVRLSRWYGIEFQVADPVLLKARVNAVFPSIFNQADVNAMGTAIKASVRRSANVITFSKMP